MKIKSYLVHVRRHHAGSERVHPRTDRRAVHGLHGGRAHAADRRLAESQPAEPGVDALEGRGVGVVLGPVPKLRGFALHEARVETDVLVAGGKVAVGLEEAVLAPAGNVAHRRLGLRVVHGDGGCGGSLGRVLLGESLCKTDAI